MPRRKTKKSGKEKLKKKKSIKKWKLDLKKVVPEVTREVIERLGLSSIGINENDIYDIIEDIVHGIAENRSTKPSIESIIKNIERNKNYLYKIIANKLIEKDNITLEQLEFIVAYAPESAGRAAPKLYHIAKQLGAEHIIDTLRVQWLRYGKPTPFICPACGFRALGPDLRCIVCGSEVDEKDIKKQINFDYLLKNISTNNNIKIYEILSAGFVLYDGETLYPPSSRPLLRKPVIELYLSNKEKQLIRKLINEKLY